MISADDCMTIPIQSLLAEAAASMCRLIAFTSAGPEVAKTLLGRTAICNEERRCCAYGVALKLRSEEVVRHFNRFIRPKCPLAMARENPFVVALVFDQFTRGALHED